MPYFQKLVSGRAGWGAGPAEVSIAMPALSVPQAAQLFQSLANATRLRLLQELARQSEVDVTRLTQVVDSTQATVSGHLALLRRLQLVKPLRQGHHVFYRLHSPHVRRLWRLTCGW
jgi:DNA-binding transcriptional ArsR family regulator